MESNLNLCKCRLQILVFLHRSCEIVHFSSLTGPGVFLACPGCLSHPALFSRAARVPLPASAGFPSRHLSLMPGLLFAGQIGGTWTFPFQVVVTSSAFSKRFCSGGTSKLRIPRPNFTFNKGCTLEDISVYNCLRLKKKLVR